MTSTYAVYLGNREISDHETFAGALEAYSKVCLRPGAHIRSPHGDDEHDGFTEGEREAMNAAYNRVAPPTDQIIDLFEALKASLEKSK